MSGKPTKGPWHLDNEMHKFFWCVRNEKRQLVATIPAGTQKYPVDVEKKKADARLVSASPDLLEALEMVRDADNDCKRDGLPTIPHAARAKIDAALNKATGETP